MLEIADKEFKVVIKIRFKDFAQIETIKKKKNQQGEVQELKNIISEILS